MTREEAQLEFFTLLESGIIDFKEKNIIDKIYDSFENRTCENCIHYKQSSTHIFKTCYANKVNGFNLESDIDFSCNKWEKNES